MSTRRAALSIPLPPLIEAGARLGRPSTPVAWPGYVYSLTIRGQPQCHRSSAPKGSIDRDREAARELEASRPLYSPDSPWRFQVRAKPPVACSRPSPTLCQPTLKTRLDYLGCTRGYMYIEEDTDGLAERAVA